MIKEIIKYRDQRLSLQEKLLPDQARLKLASNSHFIGAPAQIYPNSEDDVPSVGF